MRKRPVSGPVPACGQGLSLSYDIVTQGHGGTLTVEIEEGQGAAFVVGLPTTPVSGL